MSEPPLRLFWSKPCGWRDARRASIGGKLHAATRRVGGSSGFDGDDERASGGNPAVTRAVQDSDLIDLDENGYIRPGLGDAGDLRGAG